MGEGFEDRWHIFADRQQYHRATRSYALSLKKLQEENLALQKRIEGLEYERNYYRSAFEAISNAGWWKLTAPLRRLCEKLQKSPPPPPAPERQWEKPKVSAEETELRSVQDAQSTAIFGIEAAVRSAALTRSLEAQTYRNWQWGSEGSDYTLLLDADCELHPYALSILSEALSRSELVYCDELAGEKPIFRFAYSPYAFRGSCDPGTLLALRTDLLSTLPEGEGRQERILRLFEGTASVEHIPYLLCATPEERKTAATEEGCAALSRSLARSGQPAAVSVTPEGYYHVAYEITGTPLVSIVIPNWEHFADISACLESVFAKTTYPNFEVIIVRNGRESEEISAFYAEAERRWENLRVLPYSGGFNYSAICNFGVRAAGGEYVLLLNNDMEVIAPDWIQEMLMLTQQEDVGIVGAKLLYPDETVQHCGMAFTSPTTIEHLFRGVSTLESGPCGFLQTVQEVTAVTGACILLRHSLYESLSSLDESLAVSFSDVDLCMKARAAGFRVLCTPFATLYHFEGSSRGKNGTEESDRIFLWESEIFFTRWGEWSKKGDLLFSVK